MPIITLGQNFSGDPALLYWKYVVQDFVLNPNVSWLSASSNELVFRSNTTGHEVVISGSGFPSTVGNTDSINPFATVNRITVVTASDTLIIDGADIAFTWEYLTDEPTLAETVAAFRALGGSWYGSLGADVLYGAGTNDDLHGLSGSDQLAGKGGDDILDGGLGKDIMAGGTGWDVYFVDNSADVVSEAVGGAPGGIDQVFATASYTLGANVEDLTLTGSAHINATGNGLANALTGNAGNNVLNGKAGADAMAGGAGDDTYYVDNAGDAINESAGAGGAGSDTVISTLSFTLNSDLEHLTLAGLGVVNGTGNASNNILIGNAVANTLTGGLGNDLLNGGLGFDILDGGSGNDTYVITPGDTIVDSGGTDTVSAAFSLDFHDRPDMENLTLLGVAALNATGNDGVNTLKGNAGANKLDGRASADTLIGGMGNDTYVVDNTGDIVTELAGGGIDVVQASVSYALGDNSEKLSLTGVSNINGTGNALSNIIIGNSGNNRLDGAAGNDLMTGGAGDDIYVVGSVGDKVFEAVGGGNDTVESSMSLALALNVETLTLTGAANINGTGNALSNTLTGNAGNNVLNGGLGADSMNGGLGDDTYLIDNINDSVIETLPGGWDKILTGIRSIDLTTTAFANIEDVTLTGTGAFNIIGNAADNTLIGNAGANQLFGNAAEDTLDGKGGADTMNGGAGDDTFIFGAGDTIVEALNEGTDTVVSSISHTLGDNVENLTLTGVLAVNATGNALNNSLDGNAAANKLTGGAGADTLNGGRGNDVLIGGADADAFVFNAMPGLNNCETIVDFLHGQDVLRFDLDLYGGLGGTGALSAGMFHSGVVNSATEADDRFIYNTNSGALYYDADGVGGTLGVKVAILSNHAALDSTDITVV